MAKSHRRAGQTIRELAFKRRLKAIAAFASAGFILSFPVLFIKLAESLLNQLMVLNPNQAKPSVNLSLLLYGLCGVAALSQVLTGTWLWKRANHADQGAQGEEDIGQIMALLDADGWQIEYGLRLGNGLGDADIVCISPQKKAYVIDVKSHRGHVTTDGKQLLRQMGRETYPFEKDFLAQAMKQALQVKKQKKLSFVTPIVAFSNAKVSLPSNGIRHVYVVEKAKLIGMLRSLG